MRTFHSAFSAYRRLRVLIIGMLAGALLLQPGAQPPIGQALGRIETTQKLSSTGDHSEVPQIAHRGGRLGAIWGERFDSRLGFNATERGAAWPAASYFGVDGASVKYQWPDIGVDNAGTSHVAYAVGDRIYHRSRPVGRGWSSAHTIATSPFPNPIRLAVAPDGTLWVVWRDADGTAIFYKRSTNGGVSWNNGSDGGVVLRERGNMFAPDVTVDQNNIPHVTWYARSGGPYRGEILVADWSGTHFTTGRVTNDGSTIADQDPSITSDPQNGLHLTWRKQSGDSWIIMHAHRPSGGSWRDFTPIHTINGDAKYPPQISSDITSSLYITYSQPTGTKSRGIFFVSKVLGAGWEKPLQISRGPWDSFSTVVGSLGTAHVAYEHESGGDDGDIYYSRVFVTEPLGAQMKVDTSTATSINNQITVSFTDVTGIPDGVRYQWDAPPTDANPWVPFAPQITINGPPGAGADECETRTLFVQLKQLATVSRVMQAAGVFDANVQAEVNALNPNLFGLPGGPGLGVLDTYAKPSDGASDGDRGYTRQFRFFLGISGLTDCSHLKQFSVAGGSATPIAGDTFNSRVTLPGAATPGARSFDVQVLDQRGNPRSWSFALTYDPADTDPSATVTNTQGLPKLAPGGTAVATGTNSIIQTLSFDNIAVTDNLYGQKEGLPAGKQFWGVWIANTISPTVKADSPTLQWYPVRVAAPDQTFSVTWNLFTGLGYTSDLLNKPGDYYIFVRFLDGAGNASLESLKLKVTLEPGYSIPTLRVPTIQR